MSDMNKDDRLNEHREEQQDNQDEKQIEEPPMNPHYGNLRLGDDNCFSMQPDFMFLTPRQGMAASPLDPINVGNMSRHVNAYSATTMSHTLSEIYNGRTDAYDTFKYGSLKSEDVMSGGVDPNYMIPNNNNNIPTPSAVQKTMAKIQEDATGPLESMFQMYPEVNRQFTMSSGGLETFTNSKSNIDDEDPDFSINKSLGNSRRQSARRGRRGDIDEEARRQNHNEIERKRRENISNLLTRLNDLMNELTYEEYSMRHPSPSCKTVILSRACDYFDRVLKMKRSQNEMASEQMKKRDSNGSDFQL